MSATLDSLHGSARRIPALHRVAVVSRILLALAFIPTGMVKVLGRRFTTLGIETPIGGFFEAMYQTGFYWNLIGWAQVAAGVLLLVPSLATLGALVAFPLALNIFAITVSLDFAGTPIITGGMLLAVVFLLCWDYHRLKGIVRSEPDQAAAAVLRFGTLERAGYALGTACGLGVLGWTRDLVPRSALRILFALGLLAVLMVLAAWVRELLSGTSRIQPDADSGGVLP